MIDPDEAYEVTEDLGELIGEDSSRRSVPQRGGVDMTRREEARRWRLIGRGFERLEALLRSGAAAPPEERYQFGLCYAAYKSRLPVFDRPGSIVHARDYHGPTWRRLGLTPRAKLCAAAAWRALSAYLIAEMVFTGDAPRGGA